jgi:lysophospholipase L1-like esterase
MRKQSHRLRALAAIAAAAVVGLAACDTSGGHGASPHSTTASPRPVWNPSPDSIAAVGDSITRGFDACNVLSDCPTVSWATGSDASVDSLAVRLLGRTGAAGHSWNYAVTGARMADVPAQMARAARRRPELVTVMAGANDACRPTTRQMTPVADFRS